MPPRFRLTHDLGEHDDTPGSTRSRRGPRFNLNALTPPPPGTQFASTPRFVLPQDKKPIDKVETSDEESSPGPQNKSRPRHRGLIEDVESQSQENLNDEHEHVDLERCSFDSEFDEFSPPETDRSKRRRISLEPDIWAERADRTSSPEPAAAGSQLVVTPARRQPTTPAPASSRRQFVRTNSQTPDSSSRTPFRNPPRFVLSANYTVDSATPGPPSSQNWRKPNFVLPRSPSPSQDSPDRNQTSPTAAFSPPSAAQRRGRLRAAAPSYVPGGIAAQTRTWILDMAAKREEQVAAAAAAAADKYLFRARVESCRHETMASAAVVLARARIIHRNETEEWKNLFIVGPPKSAQRSNTAVLPGDTIAVYRGLSWELDLGRTLNGTWQVVVEWDII